MKNIAIYVSNTHLIGVVGEPLKDMINIHEYFSIPFADETLLNGMILDKYQFNDVLLKVKELGVHKANLIIDSSRIIAKPLNVPKMKEKDILSYIESEILTDNNDEELVFDYSYLGVNEEVKGSSRILAVGVEKEMLESYISSFTEVGIEILSIDYSLNVLIEMTHDFHELEDKSYIVNQLDGNNIISILFKNNSYMLTNRARLFSTPGTYEFETEIINSISQFQQFASPSIDGLNITDMFFFNFDMVESEAFSRMTDVFGITPTIMHEKKKSYVVNRKEPKFEYSNYFYPTAYLVNKGGN